MKFPHYEREDSGYAQCDPENIQLELFTLADAAFGRMRKGSGLNALRLQAMPIDRAALVAGSIRPPRAFRSSSTPFARTDSGEIPASRGRRRDCCCGRWAIATH